MRAIALVPLLLASCTYKIELDWFQQAANPLPEGIGVLTPVDRVKSGMSKDIVSEVSRLLREEGYYQVTPPLGISNSTGPLVPETAALLCQRMNATSLLILEELEPLMSWDDSKRFTSSVRTEENEVDGELVIEEIREERELVRSTLSVTMRSRWTTYSCDAQVLDNTYIFASREVFGEGDDQVEAHEAAGAHNQLHVSCAEEISERLAKRISPRHETIARTYYTGGTPLMRSAQVSMERKDWATAEQQLKSAYEETATVQRGKVAFNQAVVKEAQGDLLGAITYAELAVQQLANSRAEQYLKDLHDRSEKLIAEEEDTVTSPVAEIPQLEAVDIELAPRIDITAATPIDEPSVLAGP